MPNFAASTSIEVNSTCNKIKVKNTSNYNTATSINNSNGISRSSFTKVILTVRAATNGLGFGLAYMYELGPNETEYEFPLDIFSNLEVAVGISMTNNGFMNYQDETAHDLPCLTS